MFNRYYLLHIHNILPPLRNVGTYKSCDVTVAEEGPELFNISLAIACVLLVALDMEYCMCG